jgi:hypothetical protein
MTSTFVFVCIEALVVVLLNRTTSHPNVIIFRMDEKAMLPANMKCILL